MVTFYIILLSLGIVIFRVGFKLITNISPSNSMLIVWITITIFSLLFWWYSFTNKVDRSDILWVLMIALMTFFVDYFFIKLIQSWISPTILNISTTTIGLVVTTAIFYIYFWDKINNYQFIWVILSILWSILLLSK